MELRFFKQKQDGFITHGVNLLLIVIAILLLGWAISVFIVGYAPDFKSINTVVRTLAPLWIILAVYWLSIAIVRIRVVPARNEMIKGFLFGLYEKRYILSIPLEVSVATNLQRGKRVDSDVYVKTQQKIIKIRRFQKSSQIEPFIGEFKSLFDVISG